MTGGVSGVGAALGYAFGEYIDARNSRATMDQQKLSLLVSAARRDASTYEQDLIDANSAIEESQEAIRRLKQRDTAASSDKAYREQARNLQAISTFLQMFIRELHANQAVMREDVQEVQDNIEIGDKGLNPAPLQTEIRSLKNKQTRMVSQHRKLTMLANTLPQRERPAIDPVPDFLATSEQQDAP